MPPNNFDDIPEVKVTKDMLDLAKHIVQTKSGHFQPEKFEDHYETALRELLEKKQAGVKITPREPALATNVVNLMDALRRSIEAESGASKAKPAAARGRKEPAKPKRTRRAG